MTSLSYPMNPDWVNPAVRQFLGKGYVEAGETPESRLVDIAVEVGRRHGRPDIAEKVARYLEAGFYSLSSPVWANFGKARGLPISCNGSYFSDSVSSILRKTAEIGMMTKLGAGTSGYISDLRRRGAPISGGGTSNGPTHFGELIQSHVGVISQSNVRRGNCAIYMHVDHPDIMEFLECRENGHPIQHLSIGVCITDDFMRRVEARDPAALTVMSRIVRKRIEKGYPYLIFIDTMNEGRPQVWKDQGLTIKASNLCTEIAHPSTDDLSFVCCLMSMNDARYAGWKDTDAVEVAIYILDAVMSEYIEKIEAMDPADREYLKDALRFAKLYRPLGLGRLGWHDLLQSRMLPFASPQAMRLNVEVQKAIEAGSNRATRELARLYGEPEGLVGYGVRNATLQAIAPTTSSSFILGQVSPSVEPHNSNYYTKDLAKGVFTYRNPALARVLEEKGQNTPETWRSIMMQAGSVQHLAFLSALEKDVFRTWAEIDQTAIIAQAGHRQKHMDQAQSINLLIPSGVHPREVMSLILKAWKMKVKSLYYHRSTSEAQEVGRRLAAECVACEG